MTKMSRYALITALAMFLAGCVGQREPAPVEEVKPAPEQPAEPQQPVPQCHRCRQYRSSQAQLSTKIKLHRLRRIFAIMTGMAQCSRWSVRCLGLTA
ncbi:fibronectin-binding protein B [Escherichia coli]|uniref:Fibronectin-binding protein B n=1 Tax=Escherichia coli TaxID=562 RepID=A0A485JG88_ECOLX|nr:fibronectin-binding protein B [Escherichia coli]